MLRFHLVIGFAFMCVFAVMGKYIFKNAYEVKTLEMQIHEIQESKESIDQLIIEKKDLVDKYTRDLETIQEFAQNDQIEALQNFYRQKVIDFIADSNGKDSIAAQLNGLKIAPLRGLLLNKGNRASKLQIDFKVAIAGEVKALGISDIDLCRICGILIDNAIEAAEQSDEKWLQIFIAKGLYEGENDWCIQIRNAYSSSSGKKITNSASAKGTNRGYGIRSLRKTIQGKNVIMQQLQTEDYVEYVLLFRTI